MKTGIVLQGQTGTAIGTEAIETTATRTGTGTAAVEETTTGKTETVTLAVMTIVVPLVMTMIVAKTTAHAMKNPKKTLVAAVPTEVTGLNVAVVVVVAVVEVAVAVEAHLNEGLLHQKVLFL